eukprot:6806739-Prymnesium_polylepis.1
MCQAIHRPSHSVPRTGTNRPMSWPFMKHPEHHYTVGRTRVRMTSLTMSWTKPERNRLPAAAAASKACGSFQAPRRVAQ